MHRARTLGWSVIVFTGIVTGSAAAQTQPASAPDQTVEDLKQQIDALRAQVETLQNQQQKLQQQQLNTRDVDETVERVLQDANNRSKLFAANGAGLTAGYDKGFFIKSEDGNFLLKPGIQFQFRYVANYREDDDPDGGGDSDLESGFEVRRVRFRFDGNAFSPKFTYSFVWDTNRNGGTVTLLDAWGQYQFADAWALRFGQFKEMVYHEKDVSAFAQLAVDRSLVDQLIGGNLTDRVQGVSLIYGNKDRALRAQITLSDGANSKNTNFENSTTNCGGAARIEYKFFGDWSDYSTFTAKGARKDLLVIGAGSDYTDFPNGDRILATADAQYKNTKGLSLYGAVLTDNTDPRNVDPDDDPGNTFDWGALGQVGYMLNSRWEVFVRYDFTVPEDDISPTGDTIQEYTIGVNRYLGADGQYGQRAKLTLDVVYLPEGCPSDQDGLGILESDGDQFVLRAQFQLML